MNRNKQDKQLVIFIDSGDTIIDESTEIRNEEGIVIHADTIPGAAETLRTLYESGYTIALVADGELQSFRNVYEENGLGNFFKTWTVSEVVGMQKPSPAMFEDAMRKNRLCDKDKNGDVYLTYGYYDASEKDDPYSDDTSIRWVFSLDEDDSVQSTATKWFDNLHGNEMTWDGVREINIDAFPGVTFRWHAEKLEAVADKETVTLYAGMPIWNVYFCDLTGDGKPELCSTISIGSGIIDNRIIVYDYAGGVSYELSDRMNYDYVLNMKNGKLIAEKRKSMQEELVSSGKLAFKDGTIQIQPDETGPNSSQK
jgi:hypothetical protein